MNTVVKTLLCAITLLSLQQYVGATSQSSEEALSANASDSSPSVNESDSGSSGAAIEIADQNRRREEVNSDWRSYSKKFVNFGDDATNFVWGKNEIERLTSQFIERQRELSRQGTELSQGEFVVAFEVLSMYSENNLVPKRRHGSLRKKIEPLTSKEFIPLLFGYLQRKGVEKGLSEDQVTKIRDFVAARVSMYLRTCVAGGGSGR